MCLPREEQPNQTMKKKLHTHKREREKKTIGWSVQAHHLMHSIFRNRVKKIYLLP